MIFIYLICLYLINLTNKELIESMLEMLRREFFFKCEIVLME